MKIFHFAGIDNEVADFFSIVRLKNDPEVQKTIVEVNITSPERCTAHFQQFLTKYIPSLSIGFMKQLLEMQKQSAPDISEVIQYDPQQNLYYWTNPMGQRFTWLPSKALAEG